MDEKLHKLKIKKTVYLVAGIIFILLSPYATFFVVVGGVLLFLFYRTNKKYKQALSKPVDVIDKINDEVNSKYIFLSFKVAGVTFKNGRKTRQAILRAFRWGDERIETVDFEVYEYEGRPAVYVKINDQIVGNVPADKTQEFLDIERTHKRDNVHAEVYGGSKLDDGSRGHYGCEITVRYLKEEL